MQKWFVLLKAYTFLAKYTTYVIGITEDIGVSGRHSHLKVFIDFDLCFFVYGISKLSGEDTIAREKRRERVRMKNIAK